MPRDLDSLDGLLADLVGMLPPGGGRVSLTSNTASSVDVVIRWEWVARGRVVFFEATINLYDARRESDDRFDRYLDDVRRAIATHHAAATQEG